MYDIITIGSSTRDVFIQSSDFKVIDDKKFSTKKGLCLDLGSKIELEKIVLTTGGGGTNTAVTFARQGLSTACVGVIGQDPSGQEILDELEREGIDTKYFQRHDDNHTAYSVILVHESGSRTVLTYKGEGQHFDVTQIPYDEMESKWLFLDSLGGHFDILQQSINWAQDKGVKVATNPGGKELNHGLEKLAPILKKIDIVIMNQEEASKLTGTDFENKEEVFAKFRELSGKIAVMTMGAKGVLVSDGSDRYEAGIPDSPVIERTGAGDSWSSGFVSEYIRSSDIEKAIQFATANASSVVTKFGSKEGILKKDDWGKWPLVEVIKK